MITNIYLLAAFMASFTVLFAFYKNSKRVHDWADRRFVSVGRWFVVTKDDPDADPINIYARFFAWYGGCDIKLLRALPSATVAKRAGFGGIMLFSILLSATIAAVTWTDIAGPTFGISTGIIWFVVLTGLERCVMVFMDHDSAHVVTDTANMNWFMKIVNSKPFRFAMVTALRCFIIYTLSYVNSTIIEMKFFDIEIKTYVNDQKQIRFNRMNDSTALLVKSNDKRVQDANAKYAAANAAYTTAIADKKARIEAVRDTIFNKRTLLNKEIEGLVGSGIKGLGPAAQTKIAEIAADSNLMVGMQMELNHKREIDRRKANIAFRKAIAQLEAEAAAEAKEHEDMYAHV